MKTRLSSILAAMVLFASAGVFAQEKKPDPKFYIFLCFGQSNMEAGARPEEQDKGPVNERFRMLAAVDMPKLNRTMGNWYLAEPPLNRQENNMGPVDWFGRTMAANLPQEYRVGVINVSVAGAKIELWEKDTYQNYLSSAPSWMQNICKQYDGNPYKRLVDVAKIAQKDGVIKGILLHQGESNPNDQQWCNKVKGIYDNLIKDLGLNPQDVPLLAGELKSEEEGGKCAAFNTDVLANLPKTLPNSHIISSKGCKGVSDGFHFNTAGMRELGTRYAIQMLKLEGFEYKEAVATQPAGFAMKVTDRGYLDTQGFSVILYHSTFHRIFVDQKNTAMEMILHGQRIATNGDVRLVPTPEQWDAVAQLKSRDADKDNNLLFAQLSFPDYQMDYRLEVAAESGGVRVSVNLDKPLPEKLAGRAGFNLEFLPSAYIDKSYAVDGKVFGVFPRSPQDPMQKVLPPADDPKKLPYQQAWDEDKGYTQPLPFATGTSIRFAAEDPSCRISVSSETGPLSLYDGRNRAQNGWFVLRTLIPTGKTKDAVVWHIRPDVIPNWTRPPMIAHSQVGYVPGLPKVAMIELDPSFDGPQTAKVLRLSDNGSYEPVFEGPISARTPWLRYAYAKFDFSSVKDPGLYVIEYAGQRTELFPIARDVYSRTWQSSLDGYLAVEMDHVSVREGYRLWHGVSHLDDARQAPANTRHFDGYSMGANTDSPFQAGQHIPGLNVGGWYDAGDFDIRAQSQYAVIQELALAYEEFDLKWDQLTVDEKARSVEMHRPDGIPDAVQQVKHGIVQVLAQIKAFGHPIPGIIAPTLRQYTHLGDGASKTDGRVYSEKLGLTEMEGNFSGIPDDRWAFTTKTAGLQYGAAASLAAAARVLKGWDDALAQECLDTAIRLWDEEHASPTPSQFQSFNTTGGMANAAEWKAALELLIATNGGEAYKKRLLEMFPSIRERFGFGGWTAVHALPYMDADFRKQLEEAVKAYVAQLDTELARTPFGVPPSESGWGRSAAVVDLGIRMYFLHKAFPQTVGTDYTFRAVNYILGTHPVSSTSYVSSVGTSSKLKAYGNNRADNTFIPGGVIPGYVVIKPDFPECIDDFGFLWFEDEYVIDVASKWILAANAADALAK